MSSTDMLKIDWPEDEIYNSEIEGQTTELKNLIIDYVGNKVEPENNDVTLSMVIEVLADEFPEVVLALAEENFIRGYQQGANDMDTF